MKLGSRCTSCSWETPADLCPFKTSCRCQHHSQLLAPPLTPERPEPPPCGATPSTSCCCLPCAPPLPPSPHGLHLEGFRWRSQACPGWSRCWRVCVCFFFFLHLSSYVVNWLVHSSCRGVFLTTFCWSGVNVQTNGSWSSCWKNSEGRGKVGLLEAPRSDPRLPCYGLWQPPAWCCSCCGFYPDKQTILVVKYYVVYLLC